MGVAVLVVALAFSATLAGIKWHRADQVQAQRDDRAALTARAVGVATSLFTYDYRNLAATERYLSGAATGGFAQREAAHDAAVQAQLRAAKAVGSATVKEVSVSDIADGQATAFVVLMTHVTSTTSGSADSVAYLHLHLVEVDDAWKVDDVQNLKAAS
ncbi:MAG TPA: hypothetical protein VHD81_12125 [Mycobacteriales bacterium]|nr:hypothetical protein [Mycobacteriales bacterium]